MYGERLMVTSLAHYPQHLSMVMKIIPVDEVFQDQACRVVYQSLKELYIEKLEIKPQTVIANVKKRGFFDLLKKEKLSLSFSEMMPNTEQGVREQAQGILSQYRRTLTRDVFKEIGSLIYSDNLEDNQIAEKIMKSYEAMTLTGGKSLEKTSKDATREALADIDKAMRLHMSGKISGVSWGSKKMDKAIGGMQDDQVIVIAARPGMGKTAVAVDIALQAAREGTPVGYISMEMPAKRIKYRMAASYTGIPYSRMRKGEISMDEYKQLENALSDIGRLPIYYFDDTETRNIAHLEAVATEWARVRGIGLLVIDYVQYLEAENGNLTDTARVTKVSKSIKKMQRNLGIPIIGLAQLNRGSEGRGDPRPQLSDLKDSGQLEQDASLVIGLFNPVYYTRMGMDIKDELNENPDAPFEDGAYVYYVRKHRDGEVCRIIRYAELSTNRFSDHDDVGKAAEYIKPELTNINNLPITTNSFFD